MLLGCSMLAFCGVSLMVWAGVYGPPILTAPGVLLGFAITFFALLNAFKM